jgi:hypothetical protein
MVPVATDGVPVREASSEEGRALLDKMAHDLLSISADEFIEAWDRGDYRDSEDPRVVRVSMLLPFVR